MIPSRGPRWTGQNVGLVRRQIGSFSARQFSSVRPRPIAGNLLLSQNAASLLRSSVSPRAPLLKSNLLIRNATGIRLASTTPQPSPAISIANATPTPPDQAASSAAALSESPSPLDGALDFSDGLSNITEQIGYLKALGLDYGWGPTSIMQWTLEHIHVYAGTPWWGTIAIAAILVRGVLFKAYVNAAENGARMATVKPITQPLTKKMNEARAAGDSTLMMQYRAEITRINKRAGISILKSFVPLLQAFAGYGTFRLLRGMAVLPVPGMEDGGLAWFYNLTIPDPYFILPLTTASVLHWLLRRGGETGASTLSPTAQKAIQWILPGLTLVFTSWLPAGVQLSFFVSGVLSFIQASLLRQPWFRGYFKMTPLPKTHFDAPSQSPYKGKLNMAQPTVLPRAEINTHVQKTSENFPQPPVKGFKKFMTPVLKPFQSIKEDTKGVVDAANKKMDERRAKTELNEAKEYERKRQREIEQQELEWDDKQERLRSEKRAHKEARRNKKPQKPRNAAKKSQ